jgi:cell fate regulator YaaT (PSP1 superfamily)
MDNTNNTYNANSSLIAVLDENNDDKINTDNSAEKKVSQVEIIGVKFKKSGKIYYFDPTGLNPSGVASTDLDINIGDSVIVETARGIEYGKVALSKRLVDIESIVTPLKKVLRIATQEDEQKIIENNAKEKEARAIWFEKIKIHKLDMKLIETEYTFDNSKLLFYFTAEGRVDFRELVKDLAAIFKTRIELRQIGPRDEIKIMGGFGICGRAVCCKQFLSDFMQVSIKMAKEQSLSLNSSKISGACGRLMCCLRYEYNVYEEELKKLPSVNNIVQTADGDGIVIEINVLAKLLKIRPLNNPELPVKIYKADDIVRIKGFCKTENDTNTESTDVILE